MTEPKRYGPEDLMAAVEASSGQPRVAAADEIASLDMRFPYVGRRIYCSGCVEKQTRDDYRKIKDRVSNWQDTQLLVRDAKPGDFLCESCRMDANAVHDKNQTKKPRADRWDEGNR